MLGQRRAESAWLTRLVYCEPYDRIEEAIAREKAMKAWQRRWKTKLIEAANPNSDDLFAHIVQASF
jgi:putative endonuclease